MVQDLQDYRISHLQKLNKCVLYWAMKRAASLFPIDINLIYRPLL